jgi:hypothetical protein
MALFVYEKMTSYPASELLSRSPSMESLTDDCGDDAKEIWPEDVETAFQEAYELYPCNGRIKIKCPVDGKLYGNC